MWSQVTVYHHLSITSCRLNVFSKTCSPPIISYVSFCLFKLPCYLAFMRTRASTSYIFSLLILAFWKRFNGTNGLSKLKVTNEFESIRIRRMYIISNIRYVCNNINDIIISMQCEYAEDALNIKKCVGTTWVLLDCIYVASLFFCSKVTFNPFDAQLNMSLPDTISVRILLDLFVQPLTITS